MSEPNPTLGGPRPEGEGLALAEKLHQGLSARLFGDLARLRTRLSPEQVTAYETALRDIKLVNTLDEAQGVLQILFDKIHTDATNMPSAGNDKKDQLLQVAQEVAELKTKKALSEIVEQTIVRY